MRYLIGFVLLLVASPLSASAQVDQGGATSEPNLQEPAPSSEPAPEEPALQLQLDDAGVEVVPTPPRTPDGYTLEEVELLRVKRAEIGRTVSVGVVGAGSVMVLVGGLVALAQWGNDKSVDAAEAVVWTGVALVSAGVVGLITTVAILRVRKRKARKFKQAHHETPRRVQWDLARSRLVF